MTKICANEDCDVEFTPTRHNQKYCSKDCCRTATNAKIMKQYYEKKERKSGKIRICKQCKITKLSRYNEGKVCQPCIAANDSSAREDLLRSVGLA